MKLKFALDTNCIIELDEQRVQANELRHLSELAKVKQIYLSILGISASENQKGGGSLSNFSDFTKRLTTLDLAHLEVLKPIGFYDITYWDWSIEAQEAELNLLDEIWKTMFPKINRDWKYFAEINNVALDDLSTKVFRSWKNAMCDAQIAWATIKYEHYALITLNTKDFQKNQSALRKLGLKNILTPKEALSIAPTHPH